jgi:putative transposase
VSNLNKKIYVKIEARRNRWIESEHPYLYRDGIVMKRSWAGEVRNVHCWWPRPSTLKDFARS